MPSDNIARAIGATANERIDNLVDPSLIEVDSDLDSSSVNPVQNKALATKFEDVEKVVNKKADKTYVDAADAVLETRVDALETDKADDNKVVHNTGDEVVSGHKRFNTLLSVYKIQATDTSDGADHTTYYCGEINNIDPINHQEHSIKFPKDENGIYRSGTMGLNEDIKWKAGEGENSIVQKESNSFAKGKLAVAHGLKTHATGEGSHAQGLDANALGEYSHAEGVGTVANNRGEHAEGFGNVSHTDEEMGGKGTLHSVGIGNPDDAREHKNAFEILKDGKTYLVGVGGYDGTNPKNSKTLQKVLEESALNLENGSGVGSVQTKSTTGVSNTTTGSYATTLGYNNINKGGQNNLVIGYKNNVDNATQSIITGTRNNATDSDSSIIAGTDNVAKKGFIFGEVNTTGNKAIVLGDQNTTNNKNITIGDYNKINGRDNIGIGKGLICEGSGGIILGTMNKSMDDTIVEWGVGDLEFIKCDPKPSYEECIAEGSLYFFQPGSYQKHCNANTLTQTDYESNDIYVIDDSKRKNALEIIGDSGIVRFPQGVRSEVEPEEDSDLINLKYFKEHSGGGEGEPTLLIKMEGTVPTNEATTKEFDLDIVSPNIFDDLIAYKKERGHWPNNVKGNVKLTLPDLSIEEISFDATTQEYKESNDDGVITKTIAIIGSASMIFADGDSDKADIRTITILLKKVGDTEAQQFASIADGTISSGSGSLKYEPSHPGCVKFERYLATEADMQKIYGPDTHWEYLGCIDEFHQWTRVKSVDDGYEVIDEVANTHLEKDMKAYKDQDYENHLITEDGRTLPEKIFVYQGNIQLTVGYDTSDGRVSIKGYEIGQFNDDPIRIIEQITAEYDVVCKISGCKLVNSDRAVKNKDYKNVLAAEDGGKLPASLKVMQGSVELKLTSYDPEKGQFVIPGDQIGRDEGDIVITEGE